MAQSTSPAAIPQIFSYENTPSSLVTRSNSILSTASSGGVSLRRKSRTRTRTLTSRPRGKSLGRPESANDNANFLDLSTVEHTVPSVPGQPFPFNLSSSFADFFTAIVCNFRHSDNARDRPETAGTEEGASSSAQASPSTQGTVRHRAQTTGLVADVSKTLRGRQARSEAGSLRGVRSKLSSFLPSFLGLSQLTTTSQGEKKYALY